MSTHAMLGFIAGDDWELRVTVQKSDGSVFDLSGAALKFTLLDPTGQPAIADNEAVISIVDAAAGKCSVVIPAAVSTRLEQGVYSDALRVTSGGVVFTPLDGLFNVAGDPWKAAAAVTANVRPLRPRQLRRA